MSPGDNFDATDLEALYARLEPGALLSRALDTWVETLGAQDRPALRMLWIQLAMPLCDRRGELMPIALSEIHRESGNPPVEFLTWRLRELRAAGLAPYYLLTSIRHAMDQLVAGHLPEALDAWRACADAAPLRPDQWFGVHPREDRPLRWEFETGEGGGTDGEVS